MRLRPRCSARRCASRTAGRAPLQRSSIRPIAAALRFLDGLSARGCREGLTVMVGAGDRWRRGIMLPHRSLEQPARLGIPFGALLLALVLAALPPLTHVQAQRQPDP